MSHVHFYHPPQENARIRRSARRINLFTESDRILPPLVYWKILMSHNPVTLYYIKSQKNLKNGETMDLVKMTSPCGRDCFNCPIFLSKDDPRKVFNLCLIKKMGLEKWAETKANKVFETYFKEKLKI